MIIRKITIRNFQSYYDEQTLEFSEGLNLIIGKGGKGKSKLFNAFYWALFGKIYITGYGWVETDSLHPNSIMKPYGFVNQRALYLAQEDEVVETSVTLELEDDKGFIYNITRLIDFTRKNGTDWNTDDSWGYPDHSSLKIIYETNGGNMTAQNDQAIIRINELFPKGIREYIWFQGEDLEELIDFSKKDTLKSAVQHISYFPYYEKLLDIITSASKEIGKKEQSRMKSNTKNKTEFDNVIAEINKLESRIAENTEKKNKADDNISKIIKSISDNSEKLDKYGKYSNLINDLNKYTDEVEKCKENLKKYDAREREFVPKLWMLKGIDSMVKKCMDIIDEHQHSKQCSDVEKYLDNPTREKLEEILKNKKCYICGTEFEEGDETWNFIEERIRRQDLYINDVDGFKDTLQESKQIDMLVGKIQDYASDLLRNLPKIESQMKDSYDNISKTIEDKKVYQNRLDVVNSNINSIKDNKGDDPLEIATKASYLQNNTNNSKTDLENLRKDLEKLQSAIALDTSKLKEKKNEYEKMVKKGINIDQVPEMEWRKISELLASVCKRVQDKARKDLLRKIEERSNFFYTKFTEHDNGYRGEVKVNPDYSIVVDAGLNTSHEVRKKMSIINALLSLTQEALDAYYPFISDAPTSNFDIETTHKYLLGIKDIFKQSIIMTKDVVVDSKYYNDLMSQDKIAKVYVLESKLYNDTDNPQSYEVSTNIIRKN